MHHFRLWYDVTTRKMSQAGSALLRFLLLSLASTVLGADKVVVGFYSESLCPDCINLARGPMNDAVKEARTTSAGRYVV